MKLWFVLGLVLMGIVAGPALAEDPAETLRSGKALYEKHCAKCHGLGGRGTDKGPPFLDRVYRPSHHADMAFRLAVLNGVRAHHWRFGNMPPIKDVGMAELGMIIRYVRHIQREAGIY